MSLSSPVPFRFRFRAIGAALSLAALAAPVSAATLFDQAFERQQQGKPAEALQLLAEQEAALGRPTPRVESLRVYACVALKNWTGARIALTRYLQLAGPDAHSPAHDALLKLAPTIDRGLAEADAAWRQQQADEIKALETREAADREKRVAAMRRAAERVAQLEASAHTAPAEEPAETAPLDPAAVTDAQITSLLAAPDELAGWLAANAGDSSAAPLVARLKSAIAQAPLTAPLATGHALLVGLARAPAVQLSDTFPVEALAAAASQPSAVDLTRVAGRWMLRPLAIPALAGAHAHFLIATRPDDIALHAALAAGHIPIDLVTGEGLWTVSLLALPVRATHTSPTPATELPADRFLIERRPELTDDQVHSLLSAAEAGTLINLDWSDGQWTTLRWKDSPPPNLRRYAPDPGLITASDATGLLAEVRVRQPAPHVVKIVAGPGRWFALTEASAPPPLEWLLVDRLDDPTLALLLGAGRKIALLAGEEAAP